MRLVKAFEVGDHVKWNSEAGVVSGVIVRKLTSNVRIKGYVRHASRREPQYMIRSDKTDHVAIHKGSALRRLPKRGRQGRGRGGSGS
jgi:Hypervirulence associated proteins TUDOR domain